jgi:hypothetical protein
MKRSPLPKESGRGSWKDLYIAALFENDKAKLAERIALAQLVISSRRKELLMSRNDTEERQGLDNALFSLHALATSLAITPGMAAKARAS